MMRFAVGLLLGGSLLAASGCGGSEVELASVSGTVLLDGLPVQGVFVIFGAKGFPEAMAITDRDGHFELQYNVKHEGAPLGQHNVRLMTAASDEIAEFRDKFDGKPTEIPAKYTRTFETVEVVNGHNDFQFDLTTEGAKKMADVAQEDEDE